MSKVTPDSYDCPHCGEHSNLNDRFIYRAEEGTVKVSHCSNCERLCSWCNDKMISPAMPPPHEKLPSKAKHAYRRSANEMKKSPGYATVLLRESIKEICNEQKCKGINLNQKIDALIEKVNLSKYPYGFLIQCFAHPVRLIGNKSAHEIDFEIDKKPNLVEHLFGFINFIAEVLYVWDKNEPPKKK